MATGVEVAIAKRRPYFVEAGTGTGKSLAYLVPAIASGRRVVVATATIALQSQLVDKDIPLISEGLERDISAAVLKGRGNYLCLQRLDELGAAKHEEQLQLLRGRSPDAELKDLQAWAAATMVGDKEELDPAPSPELWQAVSVGPDECPGAARCPSGDRCFSELARTAAHEADVIVTNHHYYGLGLASGGELLPEHDIVIFDEAHHLPEVLSATCGSELGGGRIRTVARRLRSAFTDEVVPAQLDRVAADFDNLLRPQVAELASMTSDLNNALLSARSHADKALNAAKNLKISADTEVGAKLDRIMISLTSLIDDADAILAASESDVLWVDGTDNNPYLRRTPLDTSDILEHQLWPKRAVVMTSATLPDAIVGHLGLGPDTVVERVGSPFNYEAQGMLYCATHLPNPSHANYRQAVRDEMALLINAAGGRALGLFTSASAMREAAEQLSDELEFPVMVQGEAAKGALIERFKADRRAVLLATMSFWQGVDLPGDTLTLVTIDRIPFPRPNEPVTQARRDKAGRFAFRDVDLPRAQTLLAQAAGRLIRRSDDRGVVAVLDPRLATTKSYRWDLINAMPPLKRTGKQEEVLAFLRQLDTASSEPVDQSN
ncbi:MAG: ATP-dependent DNA helicase [Acidimicrobiales bacterium]